MEERKLKVAVIGCRDEGIGTSHARGIKQNKHTELVLGCEIDADQARIFSEAFGVPCIADYHDVLTNPEIDYVVVATPDQTHCQIVCEALRAGKDVLCEKPMALKLEECEEMMRVAKETGRNFMVGQVCRFTPAFMKAKELVDAGEIGDIYFIESEYAHDYIHMNKDFQAWRRGSDRHGLLGGGCHAVDLIRWFVGDAVEVFGYSNHKMLPGWGTDDTTVGIMKFENDVIGKVFCSTGCKRNYTMRTCVYGTKGTLIFDNTTPELTIFKDEFKGEKKLYGHDSKVVKIVIPVATGNHNTAGENESFAEAILSGDEVKVSGREGAATVATCSAIIEACKTGLPVKVKYNF